MALELGREDVLRVFDIYMTKIPAYEKEIKKKVDKLFQLATELKEEVDKTDSAKVLSLAMLKKAEEIEKLAKDIKSRAKG